ncbi:hypothetical protein COY20_01915 [Candidatus Shapirobacteria bacterium CG_4_10_14_0_2_um_filter_40_12]|uniref:BioF2-like acetyltransferase domain-containing protein n=1 Tax=Candidatus Shapirobacteria bacterium CG_4_10_14_0_2_um_filter_40_12 TaxID=1974871 RepID=A0A2M7TTF7_9BACT|nr:MAG: hypothetical protein COY20_01915 [Candidatus Shapirobacteria bacterium CG_4_10_14_0_2_um_filter_40_12]
MVTVLKTLDGLKEKQSFINSLFDVYGEIYLQHYLSFEAIFLSKPKDDFCVFIDQKNNLLSAFEKKSDGVWQCSISGCPILGNNQVDHSTLKTFFDTIRNKLETHSLYFPLIYRKCRIFNPLKNVSGMQLWPRLPSPIISGDLSEASIWNRVVERYGGRAYRQKKKFEENLFVKSVNRADVENIIGKIESNSWKKRYGQDMLSRDNQFIYYTNIVKTGLADMSVAFDHSNCPAAFRIDAHVGRTLFVIKWSYDENFKQYSPGFYLLTVDLFKKCGPSDLGYIDLYGSPDMMKNLLETDRLERVDLCYSSNQGYVDIIRTERTNYDAKIFNNYQNQQSIKKLFNH